jgi:hypothetical protein
MSKLITRETDDRVTTLCLLGEWDMANVSPSGSIAVTS